MVKECRVLTNNEAVTVIDYDGTLVQMPSIHRKAKTVNVVHENGKYIVVGDDYHETTIDIDKPQKRAKKKTTFYENDFEISEADSVIDELPIDDAEG